MKHRPNSKYWRKKADLMWSNVIRQVGECEMCHRQGIRGEKQGWTNLYAHHLIEKSYGRKFRHDVSNGISLCAYCHKWDALKSPHRNRDGFREWLKEHRPGQYQWLLRNEQDKKTQPINYEQNYIMLNEMFNS